MKKVGLQEQKGGKNIVHEEQIWRDHISSEIETRNRWENNWGFTKDLYREMSAATLAAEGKVEVESQRTPIPATTQGLIGWRKTNPLYRNLSHEARGVKSIHKHFKWPIDGCP